MKIHRKAKLRPRKSGNFQSMSEKTSLHKLMRPSGRVYKKYFSKKEKGKEKNKLKFKKTNKEFRKLKAKDCVISKK